MYYVAIAVAVTGILVLGASFTRPLGADVEDIDVSQIVWRYGLFVANVAPTTVPTSLEVLWSICVEEQFYLLFPILWVRSSRPSPVLRVVAVALAVAWSTRIWLAVVEPGLIYRNPIAHADHLLLGSLLAQLAHSNGRAVAELARRAGPLADVVTLGLLMLVVAWRTAAGAPAIEWWAHYLVSAILCATLVGLLAFGDGVLARALARPTAVFLGTLTYSGYVFHIYPLAVAWVLAHRLVPGSALEIPLRAIGGTVGTFMVAYASKRLFEDRILALKSRFS